MKKYMLYSFQLWREFKLSIAEIISIFPDIEIIFWDKKNLIVSWLSQDDILEKISRIWWTIKVSKISEQKSYEDIFQYIYDVSQVRGWKFHYWISIFGKQSNLKTTLIWTKKFLKEKDVSSRFVNQDFSNMSSAIINGEKLVEKWSDFTIINTWDVIYLGQTIWVQDIEAYSKRDYGKSRDMQIWMLPPKLSQIMINISYPHPPSGTSPLQEEEKQFTIYDPFCGLGTILIESQHMWNKDVYGSDFNPEMIEASLKNTWSKNIFLFDARDMAENDIFKNNIDAIVTEWFLWEIMTKKNISHERIDIQRNNLSKLYEKCFSGLQSAWFDGNIVISFPFWEIDKKYFYFTEIYEILEKYCEIQSIFPENIDLSPTKSWSLLYKRDSQLVWREIFKLKIKK